MGLMYEIITYKVCICADMKQDKFNTYLKIVGIVLKYMYWFSFTGIKQTNKKHYNKNCIDVINALYI